MQPPGEKWAALLPLFTSCREGLFSETQRLKGHEESRGPLSGLRPIRSEAAAWQSALVFKGADSHFEPHKVLCKFA